MGKTRKPRYRAKKSNPVGIPSLRDISLNEELNGDEHPEGALAAIRDQLQSGSTEEKMCGLQAMAFLSLNQKKAQAMCEGDIIRIAIPLLVDPNKNIRNAVTGALRNVSLCDVDICELLVEQDILTPLLTLINEYTSAADWVPVIDRSVAHIDQLDIAGDTFLQAVNLVWNLCESTSVALQHFNQTNILESFVRFLNYTVFGIDISVAVAQCLLVISEDNPVAWRVLNNFAQDIAFLITNIERTEQNVVLRTVAAAILSNVPSLSTTYINQIFDILNQALDINHRTLLGKLTSSIPLDREKEENSVGIEVASAERMEEETEEQATRRRRKQDLPTEHDIEIKHVAWILEAQRIAAETITNICSSDDNDGNALDDDDLSDAESVHDYDKDSSNSSGLQGDKLPIEILEPIKSLGLVEKLWQLAQPIAENVNELLKEAENGLFKKVKTLRISSLLCLQNLCNVMSIEDLGGASAVYNVWIDLGQQVFQNSHDIALVEASTALMRATLDHLRTSTDLFKQMTQNDLEMMLKGAEVCTEPEIRANWLRMLGVLGCLLPENSVKIIIECLLQQCFKETDVWTLSEALDALMDLFSDNDWNQISYELNLAQKTRELEKILKHKLRQQKRELSERYPAVCTVRTNLTRFVKYVEAEQRKYKP
ncbi:HEAT repeat-containing protein 3 [Sitodiplosis mosellana]|uniref:HEAT repeat-containing protein 3 n=1 Tax=Sitodiplosis mosellana TaxID=263140 RepID=UPI002444530F|nr:HEAT repeat-containing protein 3 [Sitodiplosis mosellana]